MPNPIALRSKRYAPHLFMAPHAHEAPVLRIVVDGAFTERIGRCERHYAGGTATLSPAGVLHAQTFGSEGARAVIAVPQSAWLEYLADVRIDLAALPYASSPDLRILGQRLCAEAVHGDALSGLACEGLLLEAIVALARRNAAAPRAARLAAPRAGLYASACARAPDAGAHRTSGGPA